GDFTLFGWHGYSSFLIKFGAGAQLAEIREALDKHLGITQKLRITAAIGVLTLLKQGIANLEGPTFGLDTLSDDSFDEEAFRASLDAAPQGVLEWSYWMLKLTLHDLHGDYPRAVEAARMVEQRCRGAITTRYTTLLPFHACLALAALP